MKPPVEQDEADEQDPGTGSGADGSLGTPTPGGEPPSAEQDANEVVSGGGVVQPDAEGAGKQVVEND